VFYVMWVRVRVRVRDRVRVNHFDMNDMLQTRLMGCINSGAFNSKSLATSAAWRSMRSTECRSSFLLECRQKDNVNKMIVLFSRYTR